MNPHALRALYHKNQAVIKQRLSDFRALPESEHFFELLFCLLTPASNAHRCWDAVQKLKQLKRLTTKAVRRVLSKHTRFHNQKTKAVLEAYRNWPLIQQQLSHTNNREMRDWLAVHVRGLGLKEASHFLRNIGKSGNELAILDRHVLRNLKALRIVDSDQIRSARHYRSIEQRFLAFAKKVKIPADELDLLFWSKETGEVFK